MGVVGIGVGLLVPLAYQDDEDGMTGGWISLGGLALGGTLCLVGVPLMIAGAWQVPIADNAALNLGPGSASFYATF